MATLSTGTNPNGTYGDEDLLTAGATYISENGESYTAIVGDNSDAFPSV